MKAKYFNGNFNLSLNLPANQLPTARPKINEAIIVETAYIVVPKTSESGLIQVIS